MAWPPASSGVWTTRHSFSAGDPRPQSIYYVNDNAIYYGDALGVAVYDAIAGTSVVLGDDTDWSLGDTHQGLLTVFNDDLYMMVTSFSDPNEKVKIFKYNGTPHSWTLVYQTDDFNPHNPAAGALIARTVDGILISSDEGIMYSTNPSLGNWSLITDQKGFSAYTTTYISNDGNNTIVALTEFEDPDYSFVLSEFNGSSFSNIDTIDPMDYVRVPGYHWNYQGTEYSIDGSTWLVPNATTVIPWNLRNYTKVAGFDDSANRVYYWDDVEDEWSSTFDTMTQSLVKTPEAFVLSDGTMIVGRYSGSTASFLERSVVLDPVYIVPETQETGKRLWIYKSEGADWISRGIRVEE